MIKKPKKETATARCQAELAAAFAAFLDRQLAEARSRLRAKKKGGAK